MRSGAYAHSCCRSGTVSQQYPQSQRVATVWPRSRQDYVGRLQFVGGVPWLSASSRSCPTSLTRWPWRFAPLVASYRCFWRERSDPGSLGTIRRLALRSQLSQCCPHFPFHIQARGIDRIRALLIGVDEIDDGHLQFRIVQVLQLRVVPRRIGWLNG
jgi:hypothetical protein